MNDNLRAVFRLLSDRAAVERERDAALAAVRKQGLLKEIADANIRAESARYALAVAVNTLSDLLLQIRNGNLEQYFDASLDNAMRIVEEHTITTGRKPGVGSSGNKVGP